MTRKCNRPAMSCEHHHTVIIAEAGVNHCGDPDMAMRMVDAAADAGADYVKFQTFNPALLVSAKARLADYQSRNLGADGKSGGQLEMLSRLRLSESDHYRLIDRCRSRGIRFLSTPFDDESTVFLASLNLDYWKIPSGEMLNVPYLERIASYKGHVLMSTGMCTDDDIEASLRVLTSAGQPVDRITLLHCNTMYPTPMCDVNLNVLQTMRDRFGLPVGYSDHTAGIEVPVAAVALGARVIEKHFTLDRSLPGPDHRASLEPDELKAMVSAIRNIELALGSGKKTVTESEKANRTAARKSIVAAVDIKAGEPFTYTNLTTRRPGDGISPLRWHEMMTLKAPRDFSAGEQIVL